MKIRYFHLLLFLSFISVVAAQTKVRVYGYVIDTNNRGIEYANVYLENTTIGTSTNTNGYYDLTAEIADSATIVFSMLGYETLKHVIKPTQRTIHITVELPVSSTQIDEVDVVAQRIQTSTIELLDPSKYRLMPNTSGGIESLFITFTGVNSNNELSSQYNVRGGNFDENIVYVNGIEVYRPLLIRSGQQEGLSFINTDMVEQVAFSSGGFDAEYGDKMSSVLDITYKKPEKFESSVSLSLLGASAYVGTAGKKFSQMHGIRYKTSAYLLGTLDTEAEYNPTFLDYQTYLTYQFSPKWELTFLGNFSQNSYQFVPQVRETKFGTQDMARRLTIYFEGQEKDLFRTSFGALTLNYSPRKNMKLSLLASAFHTNERETYDISGEYRLGEIKSGLDDETTEGEVLGIGRYHEHARNRLKATVANIGHQGEFAVNSHRMKWGANLQREIIDDKISEWEWRDSVGYSLPHNSDRLELYYNMKSDNVMSSWRGTAYFQDTYKFEANAGRFSLTGGLRANYWSFNNELLVSPRASISFIPHWDKDFSFRFATGLYYQAPFYKELRDTIIDASGNVNVHLNEDIKAQRSLHFVLGGDHYFRAFGRPFKFTTEAYLKLADRVVTYSVDNVNIRYSGKNDAIAYTAGIDFKLFGELVPGTDSWINFSLMRSREKITDGSTYTKNIYDENHNIVSSQVMEHDWVSRPNECRYALSMLFQDYWPTNPKYKLHLKFILSDGLPFGAPRSVEYRAASRLSAYNRVDIGASRGLVQGKDKIMNRPFFKHIESIWFNFEVLNLIGSNNENSVYWVTDIYSQEWAVPNYLTGRQFNFKIMVDLK
ncbi:TonB-dependent receptor [Paludibacter sp. 221]|uniref:TonB-dependent receptor n=1 Tax=Paludibacter sp. 221 TaxID=2302939 RepID=UPI0013D45A91|nr:TonB-dependent receptor [Paludibacter sp. 221]NDV46860.1 TonB-dependent receptor [Paludibacter sp. 221]